MQLKLDVTNSSNFSFVMIGVLCVKFLFVFGCLLTAVVSQHFGRAGMDQHVTCTVPANTVPDLVLLPAGNQKRVAHIQGIISLVLLLALCNFLSMAKFSVCSVHFLWIYIYKQQIYKTKINKSGGQNKVAGHTGSYDIHSLVIQTTISKSGLL